MNDNITKSEKYTINGIDFDIIGYISTDARYKGKKVDKNTPGAVPLLDIKMMSDFKWQYGCLMSRLEHPERYENIDADVSAVIEKLKQWLREHIAFISELNPNEREKLHTILNEGCMI